MLGFDQSTIKYKRLSTGAPIYIYFLRYLTELPRDLHSTVNQLGQALDYLLGSREIGLSLESGEVPMELME